MVRWWAAFFILGLIFPARIETELIATLVTGCLCLLAQAQSPARLALGHISGERSWRLKAMSWCAITCSAAIIIWGAGGIDRTAHDVALARAGHEAYHSGRPQQRVAHRGDTGKNENIAYGIRSLSLWRQRARLLELLNDNRLSKRSRGIVGALVLDDRTGLDWRLSETYSYLGITHFLALSGMHLGVIAVPLSWILSLLVRSRRLRDVLLFTMLCLYSAVAGFPPSLLRSLALCAAVIGYGHCGVHGDLSSALITGSFALAVIDFSVVFDAGFQLSCAAVYAIALIGIPLSRAVEANLPGGVRGALLKAIMFPALITCSVQFFTLPLVIALFKRSSLLSPLVNVLVSLPFTVLLYAGVLYVFVPLWPLRLLLSYPINAICRFLDGVPSSFSHGPHAALYRGDCNPWLYVGGAALVAWGLQRSCGRKRCALAAGAACVVFSFVASSNVGRDGGASSVSGSQGKTIADLALCRMGSIYLSQGQGVICIGERFDSRQSYRLTRELWGRGVQKIGWCIVAPSRLGKNHGLRYLVERISIKEVVVSPYLMRTEYGLRDYLAEKGIAVRTVSAGDRIDTGFLRLEVIGPVYPPPAGTTVTRSDAMLRCRLSADGGRAPVPGWGAFSTVPIDPDSVSGE